MVESSIPSEQPPAKDETKDAGPESKDGVEVGEHEPAEGTTMAQDEQPAPPEEPPAKGGTP